MIGYGKVFFWNKDKVVRSCAVDLMVKVNQEITFKNLSPLISNMNPEVIKYFEDRIEQEGFIDRAEIHWAACIQVNS